jgi:GrpB-like predicted nucleotidyltransferase (UPF0157 family)
MLRKVEVVPPDPTWRDKFEQESKQVARTLGENVIMVHHIGSTSIPDIYAKPIVDMLVEVKDIHQVESRNAAMEALDYTVKGEFGIPGRRYFTRDIEGTRVYHVHTFQTGSAEITRHLAFRDYLTAHPEFAQQYSDLKRSLAKQFPTDIESYMDGKDGFIKEMERNALEWRASQSIR